jgi:hypothetical protein
VAAVVRRASRRDARAALCPAVTEPARRDRPARRSRPHRARARARRGRARRRPVLRDPRPLRAGRRAEAPPAPVPGGVHRRGGRGDLPDRRRRPSSSARATSS